MSLVTFIYRFLYCSRSRSVWKLHYILIFHNIDKVDDKALFTRNEIKPITEIQSDII